MVQNMDDRWMYVEGKRAGRPYMAALAIGYLGNWRDGLPKPKELMRLQDLEDDMIEKLDGHGALVATETGAGNRTIHLLVRNGGVVEMYREYERRGDGRGMRVTV